MKKLFALFFTAIMVFALTLPCFATNITVNGGADGAEYEAFRLFNATDSGDGKFTYTLNDTYTAILRAQTGMTKQDDITAYITALDNASINTFAGNVFAAIIDAGIDADYTSDANVFADVEQGYYLIAETKHGNTADTYSLIMLETQGIEDITVITKEDIYFEGPEAETENNNTTEESEYDSAKLIALPDDDYSDTFAADANEKKHTNDDDVPEKNTNVSDATSINTTVIIISAAAVIVISGVIIAVITTKKFKND